MPNVSAPRASATPVLDLLARLVEKSLVLTEDGPNQSKWYRLQETIRHFAADRLRESGEEAAVRSQAFRLVRRAS